MTITDILVDLEAKAKQVFGLWYKMDSEMAPTENTKAFIVACSPNRILALVEYVRKLVEAAHNFEKDLSEYCNGPERGALNILLAGHLDAEKEGIPPELS